MNMLRLWAARLRDIRSSAASTSATTTVRSNVRWPGNPHQVLDPNDEPAQGKARGWSSSIFSILLLQDPHATATSCAVGGR